MRKVFFVAAEQIKNRRQQIKTGISLRLKESPVGFASGQEGRMIKTFHFYRVDSRLEEEGVGMHPDFTARDAAVAIIDLAGDVRPQVIFLVIDKLKRLAIKPGQNINDVMKPWRDAMTEDQGRIRHFSLFLSFHNWLNDRAGNTSSLRCSFHPFTK